MWTQVLGAARLHSPTCCIDDSQEVCYTSSMQTPVAEQGELDWSENFLIVTMHKQLRKLIGHFRKVVQGLLCLGNLTGSQSWFIWLL